MGKDDCPIYSRAKAGRWRRHNECTTRLGQHHALHCCTAPLHVGSERREAAMRPRSLVHLWLVPPVFKREAHPALPSVTAGLSRTRVKGTQVERWAKRLSSGSDGIYHALQSLWLLLKHGAGIAGVAERPLAMADTSQNQNARATEHDAARGDTRTAPSQSAQPIVTTTTETGQAGRMASEAAPELTTSSPEHASSPPDSIIEADDVRRPTLPL